jgi:hypothetical protein
LIITISAIAQQRKIHRSNRFFERTFFVFNRTVELQRAGARILTNMLMRTTDEDTDFRKQAVESMPFLVANKDPEICVMCVICLYFASQSLACRDPIARSGMLTVVGGEQPRLLNSASPSFL